MDVRGLVLFGELVAIEDVTKKSGEPVGGMKRISVEFAPGVRPLDATYFEADRYTGELSPVAAQIKNVDPKPGDVVAVRVKPRAAGTWVNLDAVAIQVVNGSSK